jgi:RNA polymerase sigma-70 factor (ECF subfamily)
MSMPMTETAFAAMFDEYADMLFRHAYFRLGTREKAKDMTQDTFIKAWDSVQKTGEDIASWKPFLFRILNNLIIDEYRKKKQISLDEIEEDHAATGAALPDEFAVGGLLDEIQRVDSHLDASLVARALQTLEDRDRMLIVGKFFEDESTESLAKKFSITADAVYVRIHRALKRLQVALVQEGYEA